MHLDLDRTIVALSSGTVAARRAIVRVSGNSTRHILSQLLSSQSGNCLLSSSRASSRQVVLRLEDPLGELPARAYYWPDERSYTGQPSAELHVIGSMPIVECLIHRICQLGARPAQRGEFTLRSFIAGKLDLAQAEAVLGIIEADDQTQLRIALEQLGGNLTRPVKAMRDELLQLVAHLEAGLDFAEEDISFINSEELLSRLESIRSALLDLAARLSTRSSSVRLPRCALVGLPNSGKSSLFNALVGSQRSIVTEVAGTTRDTVSACIEMLGQQVELVDTAGIEDLQDDSPRTLAQDAAQRCIAQADLVVRCVEVSMLHEDDREDSPLHGRLSGHAWDKLDAYDHWQTKDSSIRVCTKGDLTTLGQVSLPADAILTSAVTLDGIQDLKRAIVESVSGSRLEVGSAFVHQTAVRCSECVRRAREAIDAAVTACQQDLGEELVASELRLALEELSAIIGEVHTEDILGEIFSRFCIGK